MLSLSCLFVVSQQINSSHVTQGMLFTLIAKFWVFWLIKHFLANNKFSINISQCIQARWNKHCIFLSTAIHKNEMNSSEIPDVHIYIKMSVKPHELMVSEACQYLILNVTSVHLFWVHCCWFIARLENQCFPDIHYFLLKQVWLQKSLCKPSCKKPKMVSWRNKER